MLDFERDSAESERILDQCLVSGKFLGFAHSYCNLKRRTVNYIPIFAHNLSIYDLHFVSKNLHLFPEDIKIQVIPITEERYISLSICNRVASYTDRRGVENYVYELLLFVDSFGFMASSMDKLVRYLPAENFSLLDNRFPQHCSGDLQLLHQKGFKPYSYFHSHEKFQEKILAQYRKMDKKTFCLEVMKKAFVAHYCIWTPTRYFMRSEDRISKRKWQATPCYKTILTFLTIRTTVFFMVT